MLLVQCIETARQLVWVLETWAPHIVKVLAKDNSVKHTNANKAKVTPGTGAIFTESSNSTNLVIITFQQLTALLIPLYSKIKTTLK